MQDFSTTALRSVVTGSSGHLGSAICAALAKRGDDVVGLDLKSACPFGREALEMDLTDPRSVARSVEQTQQILGGIDVLVHAAGFMQTKPFLDLEDGDMQAHIDVNLMGTFRICRDVARVMKAAGGGRIVIITSIHGQIGVARRTAYAATKGAVSAMGRVMAAELAPHKIRVNMLSPGPVDGGMTPEAGSRKRWLSATPSGRVARLDEVARLVAMLTSDDASFVQGQTIAIDGGASTTKT